ncbi:MAG TPA: hypothetical protein VFI23_12850 [Rhizomicrobium sp.]|nr:hypothetical protein [Rhizomicrobium sp.]
MRRPFRLPLMLGAAWLALAGLSPARAEMLQFSTPDGVKSWPKLADIPDWHQDMESSLKLGANSMIPDGVDPAHAEVTVQARGFSRTGGGATSVSQLVESDRAAAPAGTEVKQLSDVADKDGTPFKLYSFVPATGQGGWKAVAYSEEGEYLLTFTLSARSKAAFEGNLPILTAYIQKYAKDIPW